jgi:hypothetical protein
MLQSGMDGGFQGLVFLLYRLGDGVFFPCLQCRKYLQNGFGMQFLPA